MGGLIRARIAQVVALALASGWGLAWSAVSTLKQEPDLAGLPWVQIVVGVAISAWGAVSATLGRWLAARYEGKTWFWQGEVVKDSAVGVTVGMAAYFTGAMYGLSPMQLGLVLLLAGYLGVKILSSLADRLLEAAAKAKQ